MRLPPAFIAIVLLMLSALALGCEADRTSTTAAPTSITATLPPGQPSAEVQFQLEAVLDELMANGVFGGRALCSAYTTDVTDQMVSVGFTLRNSTDLAYLGLNRTMVDVLQEYASRVAGYFGPNRWLGEAYGSRAVRVDFTIYAVHLARYSCTPPVAGDSGDSSWSAVTLYADPEIYATYAPLEMLGVFALFNDTANCSRFSGITVYLNATDADGNPTWEPGNYDVELRAFDDAVLYSNSYYLTAAFLEYPGITRGISIDASVISWPLEHVWYVVVNHTRTIDGVAFSVANRVYPPWNNC